ncbi:MAG: TatD family hydrolase [Bacteroidaceae bacterium]|nr:TatD family hydrolase [Bacteroidaceae bacterium]
MSIVHFPLSIYLNFHTHTAPHEDEYAQPSAGLHPWHLKEDWPSELAILENRLQENPTLFVGECGLDRLCDTPYDRQQAAFEAQITLSERYERPLVLHCVKSLDDVLRLKHGTRQPWIWHGFRGKPQQLRQLLQHDFYISFGFRHNPESLKACPLNRLFLETDDDPRPIASLYSTVAQLLSITPENLNAQLWKNLHQLR